LNPEEQKKQAGKPQLVCNEGRKYGKASQNEKETREDEFEKAKKR